MSGSLRLPLLILLWTWACLVQAQPSFPALSGRVVDQAGLLDAQAEARLSQRLAAHEQASGEQVVVVTLPNLQGLAIEEFGYQLGRHWGIGQKDKNNGALLLVARDERKLRIEVGYGLEERLTDAQSWAIIQQVITPAFKRGDYTRGIEDGVGAILQVLGGQPLPQREEKAQPPMAVLLVVLFFIIMGLIGGGRGGRRGALIGGLLGAGLGRGGGGGGFSGGGGSFGGGGASGGW
ncbi:MAG TPA: TPM domain-containing protein [Pseudomonas sp.]|nr:TPM domain-containing protein [Pseudomonas sp.]